MSKSKVKKQESKKPEDVLLKKIITVLEDKKAEDIRIFNVQELVDYADYFLFCSGTSNIHVKTMGDEVQSKVKKEGIQVKASGEKNSGWIVLDCGMVIVHCMGHAERAYYNLEELWQNADVVFHHY